jgi:hypothetical protein
MSTVTEIEHAIEKLPPEKLQEFAAWFDEYRGALASAESLFLELDREEQKS